MPQQSASSIAGKCNSGDAHTAIAAQQKNPVEPGFARDQVGQWRRHHGERAVQPPGPGQERRRSRRGSGRAGTAGPAPATPARSAPAAAPARAANGQPSVASMQRLQNRAAAPRTTASTTATASAMPRRGLASNRPAQQAAEAGEHQHAGQHQGEAAGAVAELEAGLLDQIDLDEQEAQAERGEIDDRRAACRPPGARMRPGAEQRHQQHQQRRSPPPAPARPD